MPKTPTRPASGLSSPPLTRQVPAVAAPQREKSRSRSRSDSHKDIKTPTVDELQTALNEAKMTAAHYKLQYHMSQMEGVEAIQRMAVEHDMIQAEQKVLQRNDRARQKPRPSPPQAMNQDTKFRLVHVDVYAAMTQEIDDLRSENARLIDMHTDIETEHDMIVASLRDRLTLLQDGIRESATHTRRYRSEIRSRANMIAHSTIQSPSARRLKAIMSTPVAPPVQPVPQPSQQAGFDALLQAAETSRPARPIVAVSLPATPQALQFDTGIRKDYATPQLEPKAATHLKAPYTAPVARKRSFDDLYHARGDDLSDGTISADHSEAETEIADAYGDQGHSPKRARLGQYQTGQRSPDGRNMGGFRPMVQSRIYAPIRKHVRHVRSEPVDEQGSK